MFAKSLAIAILFSMPLVGACSSSEVVVDELAGDESALDIATLAKADAQNDAAGYFAIRRDYRKCVAPLCGGYWVSRPNHAKTTCASGKAAAECYVAELDDSALGLTSERDLDTYGTALQNGGLLVRGDLGKRKFGTFGKLGTFTASEAWIAGTDGTADGVWVKLRDNHIVCITAPCSSIDEAKLNSTKSATISDLDFDPSGATDAERDVAYAALYQGDDGLIVVGDRYLPSYPHGGAKGRTVTQFYTRLRPATESAACYVGGCSSHVCSDQQGIITTCEFRPEYACYQTATCERQAGGECGWTETPELDACLAGSI